MDPGSFRVRYFPSDTFLSEFGLKGHVLTSYIGISRVSFVGRVSVEKAAYKVCTSGNSFTYHG